MTTFKWLLFDIDNTLLDFSGAAKRAMFKTFAQYNRVCDEAIYQQYQTVNHAVWDAFERQEITAKALRVKRMQDFFRVLQDEICDPAIFNKRFLENLVLESEYYDGVPELLQQLKKRYILSVITNGLKETQRPRLQRLGLTEQFDSIIVSDEIGVAKPHIDFFQHALQSIEHQFDTSEILVIGDSLNSDVMGGLNAGLKTCWISHGRVNQSTILPDFVIKTVVDLSIHL